MSPESLKNRLLTIVKNPFVIAFFVGIGSLHFVKELSLARRSAPPPLVKVGKWILTNENNQAFGSEDLKGKVVVANFFFTRCPSICPKLIQSMKEVRERFTNVPNVHFLSFSVDPEFDNPKVLQAYIEKNGLKEENWTFLTGTTKEMVSVIMDQMKLHMGERARTKGVDPSEALFDISHVGELVLFDQNGDLRDKFSTEPVGLASLVRSAKFLLEKGAEFH